jgi:hypothetical protein
MPCDEPLAIISKALLEVVSTDLFANEVIHASYPKHACLEPKRSLRQSVVRGKWASLPIPRQAKIETIPRLRRGRPDEKNPLQFFFSMHRSHSLTYAFFQSEIDCSA